MNIAQIRLSALATWLASSSASRKSPLGDATDVGRYACIVPSDFAEPPQVGGFPGSLMLFVSNEQAEGVNTGPVVGAAPPSQDREAARLGHILWKIGTDLPPMAVVGLETPEEAIADAVERAGASGVDLDTVPLLAVPLYALSTVDRRAIAARLPVLP